MFKRLWEWFSSHALWDAAKWLWGTGGAVVTFAAQYISGWVRGHQDIAGLLITAGVVVFFGVVSIIVGRTKAPIQAVSAAGTIPSKPMTRVEATVLKQLLVRWAAYGDVYEHLDYDNRNNTLTRLPFNESSWPAFDQPWSYTNVRLYVMYEDVSRDAKDTDDMLKAFGWSDEVSIPRTDKSTVMVDIVRDIREFTRQLEVIKQRQAWPQ
jgi:hypothetical protein